MDKPTLDDAAALLAREMQVVRGEIPRRDGPPLSDDGHLRIWADGFHFSTPGEVRFAYQSGEGLRAEVPDAALEDEFGLYREGTVFGAVCWLNGLFPLHASAIVRDGCAIALTADSGGGKSTLAMALAAHGFIHFADDTLPLLLGGDAVHPLPFGKRAKLWGDACALAGVPPGVEIAAVPGKYYVETPDLPAIPARLTDIVVLETGPELRLEPITGSAKLARIAAAMYRPSIAIALGGAQRHAERLLEIASKVRCWRLARPLSGDRDAFATTTQAVAELLGEHMVQ
ncbi:hypothetical protein [Tsuneonella mangrovi]|uniref:hypothetical protein n=1 Tax=Tsuneonella mangrovi TaxID=1982042 RepID=UPI000BA255B6|nr:hypothetical protein [Tsuneonella mangrovi]